MYLALYAFWPNNWRDDSMGIHGVLRKILTIIRKCNETIECDPKIATSWNFRGLARSYQGKCDEAIEAYNKAIDLAPEWEVPRYNKSIALQELSWTKKAEIKSWRKPRKNMLQERSS